VHESKLSWQKTIGMAASLGILEYAGEAPAPARGFFGTCWRCVRFVVVLAVLITFVIVRSTLLLAGFACVFAGTVLLTLGGKRDAARKLAAWRERSLDLMSLWWSDITRPLRRHRRVTPQPVLPQ
jgi:hypothetical protein